MIIETSPSSLSRWIRSRICALLGAHRGQRLVEEEDVGARVDGAGDRDRLALAAGEAGHRRLQPRHVDADLIQGFAGPALHLADRQERQRGMRLLAAQEHVLEDGELVDQRQVLVDGVDPQRPRLVDAARRVWLAPQEHLAPVRFLEAADDLHQGRLAGAVVAEQAEDLALAEVQVDVAQARRRAEALGDVLDAQDVVLRRGRLDDALAGIGLSQLQLPSAPCRRRRWPSSPAGSRGPGRSSDSRR